MDGYLWLKALHVLAVISWMAGMLYMPRLFIYHVEAGLNSPQAATFQVMERRLQKAIMLPAMLLTWATGLWLAYAGLWLRDGWLHGKLLLVVLMTGVHGFLASKRKKLAAGTDTHSSRFYRILNEVPTVLMIGIVILVVVKPF